MAKAHTARRRHADAAAGLARSRVFEGLYCSQYVGKSTCTGLDGNPACVCPTGAVRQDNGPQANDLCLRGAAT